MYAARLSPTAQTLPGRPHAPRSVLVVSALFSVQARPFHSSISPLAPTAKTFVEPLPPTLRSVVVALLNDHHAPCTRWYVAPWSPTAKTAPLVPQTPFRLRVVGKLAGAQPSPSQWIISPDSPAAQTSPVDEPQIAWSGLPALLWKVSQAPFQCAVRPFPSTLSPTNQTSIALAPQTARNGRSGAPGTGLNEPPSKRRIPSSPTIQTSVPIPQTPRIDLLDGLASASHLL